MSAAEKTVNPVRKQKKERFMHLFSPLHERLSRFAHAMTNDAEEARDLVGETVLIAFEQFEEVKDPKAFISYLFTIASRLHSKRKKRSRWFGSYEEARDDEMHDKGTAPDVSADVAMLYTGLAELPGKQREAVVLFEISGLTLKEVRDIQGGTLSGVKARIVRGRRKLAEILRVDDDIASASVNAKENGQVQTTDSSNRILYYNIQ